MYKQQKTNNIVFLCEKSNAKSKAKLFGFFMRECVLYYKKYGCFLYEINKCVTRMFLVFYKQERNVLFYKNDCFFSRPFPAG